MRGRYLVQSTAGYLYLRTLDAILNARVGRSPEKPRAIHRLLLGVGGHLGDAIVATVLLPEINRTLPGVEVGVAVPSWGSAVFEGHASVRWVHRIDHWKMNRSSSNRLVKLVRSVSTQVRALAEIRDVGYDAAIDLYPYYPNIAVLLERAGIPVRVGYESGGGGPAYTLSMPWPKEEAHMAVKQLRLLAKTTGELMAAPAYHLSQLSDDDSRIARRLLQESGINEAYAVLHPGTGIRTKDWPLVNWLSVAKSLVEAGCRVAVTGVGTQEHENANWLCMNEPGIVNLVGRTSVGQLRAILRGASVVVASDSAAGHLAAAEKASLVTVMAGISYPTEWKPLSEFGVVLTDNDGSLTADAVIVATMHFLRESTNARATAD